ncbi:MAG: hypothetical protein ACYDEQ_00620 [Desulfocucumaceae bacterium]|nr:hypothetical protein [candidate division TA06 bacterium]
MRVGDTFLMHLPGSASKPYYHLFIVLTDPEPGTGKLVAVMVQTAQDHTEKTVVLQKGEHPFVKQPTSVQYTHADYYFASKIVKAFARNICHKQASLDAAVLDKVRKGLLASTHTPNSILEYCRTKFQTPP